MRALVLAAALCLATPALAAPGQAFKIDAATLTRLGVMTAPLRAVRRAASVTGFVRGLGAGPLAQLDSDLITAIAAQSASQAEAARTKALAADQTVSKQVAEAADAQARSDAAKVQLLRRRVGLEWGPSLAKLSDARRGKLVADIAAGHAALVRVDSALGLSQAHGNVEIELGGGVHALAAILGPARVGDPRLQSTGALALVTGPQALQLGVGTVVPASLIKGAGGLGVVIPREALLRNAGQTFVYIRSDHGDFERRAVPAGLTDPEGLFVISGFRVGEAVVTKGASQILAAQSAPAKSAETKDD